MKPLALYCSPHVCLDIVALAASYIVQYLLQSLRFIPAPTPSDAAMLSTLPPTMLLDGGRHHTTQLPYDQRVAGFCHTRLSYSASAPLALIRAALIQSPSQKRVGVTVTANWRMWRILA